MFFFKKRSQGLAANQALSRIGGKAVRYVAERRGFDPVEKVIGREGVINVGDGRIVISCGKDTPLDKPIEELTFGELLSKNGATFTYPDGDERVTVTAYYVDYRK